MGILRGRWGGEYNAKRRTRRITVTDATVTAPGDLTVTDESTVTAPA